jgi:hypothetical protein
MIRQDEIFFQLPADTPGRDATKTPPAQRVR